MRVAPIFALATGYLASVITASCQRDECRPSEVSSGVYRLGEPGGYSNGPPFDLEGGQLVVDVNARAAVLTYPDQQGTVTFRITSWPKPQENDGGSSGAPAP